MAIPFNSQFRVWALQGLNDSSCDFEKQQFFIGYNFDSSKQKDPSFLYTVLFKRYDGLIDLLKSRECVVDAREKSSPQDVAVGLSPSMVEVSYSFDLGTLADSLNAQLSHDVMVEASKISGSYALEHPHHASRFPGTVSPASKGLALLIERAVYTLSKKEFAHVQSLYEKK